MAQRFGTQSPGRGLATGLLSGFSVMQNARSQNRALNLQEERDETAKQAGLLDSQIRLGSLKRQIQKDNIDNMFRDTKETLGMVSDSSLPDVIREKAYKKYASMVQNDLGFDLRSVPFNPKAQNEVWADIGKLVKSAEKEGGRVSPQAFFESAKQLTSKLNSEEARKRATDELFGLDPTKRTPAEEDTAKVAVHRRKAEVDKSFDSPTTAWQGFFKNKPNATIEEIAEFKQQLDKYSWQKQLLGGVDEEGTKSTSAPEIKGVSTKAAAEIGTGPGAALGAAFDSIAGGLGLDVLVGKKGFFKEEQDARQHLRLIKQLGKSALMNSSRGAIWEQKKIDKLFPDPNTFFTNPRTEARKLPAIRQELFIAKQANSEAIRTSVDPVEVRKLRESNISITRLLAHIGNENAGETSGALSPDDNDLINKYMNK